MSPSSDHHSTLQGFAAWRESLPPADRLGVWQLLTACYGEGVQGLSYEAVRPRLKQGGFAECPKFDLSSGNDVARCRGCTKKQVEGPWITTIAIGFKE